MKAKRIALVMVALPMVFGFLAAADNPSVVIEISAPKLDVFDATSQVFINHGFALMTTNERIGLITTDYQDVKKSFGGSFVLALFGKEGMEMMLTTNIRSAQNGSVLTILPKARARKISRLKEQYDEIKLSNVEGVRKIGLEIKALAEGTPVQEQTPPTPSPKPQAAKTSVVQSAPAPAGGGQSSSAGQDQVFVKVKVAAANIRKSPSTNGAILRSTAKDNQFRVIGLDNGWYEIFIEPDSRTVDGSTGYISQFVVEEVIVKAAPRAQDVAQTNVEQKADEGMSALPAQGAVDAEGQNLVEPKGPRPIRFEIGPTLAIAMGDWTSAYSVGFGGDVRIGYALTPNLSLLGDFGLYFFPHEDIGRILRISPTVGAQYRYRLPQSSLTLIGEFDLGIAIDNYTYSHYSETETALSVQVGVGLGLGFLDILPRFRFVNHEGDSFGALDLSVLFRI